MLKQGLPETIGELEAAVSNSLEAYILGASWGAWIMNGVDQKAYPATHLLPKGWNPEIFTSDPLERRELYATNLNQFLLRGLIRDCGQYVEHFNHRNGLVRSWSKAPAPIYVLRILRNGFAHDWRVGKVHVDVQWHGITFKANVRATPPEGWRQEDPLLDRLPPDLGAVELVRMLMKDVIQELRTLVARREASPR